MKKYPSCPVEIGVYCTKHGVVHTNRRMEIGVPVVVKAQPVLIGGSWVYQPVVSDGSEEKFYTVDSIERERLGWEEREKALLEIVSKGLEFQEKMANHLGEVGEEVKQMIDDSPHYDEAAEGEEICATVMRMLNSIKKEKELLGLSKE